MSNEKKPFGQQPITTNSSGHFVVGSNGQYVDVTSQRNQGLGQGSPYQQQGNRQRQGTPLPLNNQQQNNPYQQTVNLNTSFGGLGNNNNSTNSSFAGSITPNNLGLKQSPQSVLGSNVSNPYSGSNSSSRSNSARSPLKNKGLNTSNVLLDLNSNSNNPYANSANNSAVKKLDFEQKEQTSAQSNQAADFDRRVANALKGTGQSEAGFDYKDYVSKSLGGFIKTVSSSVSNIPTQIGNGLEMANEFVSGMLGNN